MGDVKACRICLVTDVKLHDLQTHPLETYFEPILGINPFRGMDLPSYACFECASLVKKYYFFRERCLRGQMALNSILRTSGKITFEDIKQVDRQNLHLTSNLTIYSVIEESVHNYNFEEANIKIKQEILEHSNTQQFDTDSIKQEDYDVSSVFMSGDDHVIQPLSLVNDVEEKKMKKKSEKNSEDLYVEIAPQQSQSAEMTFKDVKQVDRQSFRYNSNVTNHRLIEASVSDYSFDETNVNIKVEHLEATEVFDADSVKQDYDDFASLTTSSDDDEPLSLLKSIKKTKVEKRRAHQQLQDIEEEGIDFECKGKRCRRKKINMRKLKPRRTKNTGGVEDEDIDLEKYVTIVKLSVKEQIEEITNRQMSSNYLNAPYQCNLCYKGFVDTHAWTNHVGKHDPKSGDIECPICKFRFKTKRLLQRHSANHNKKYACKSCSYISKTATQAKLHQRWHEGITYKCEYCDEVSTKWTSYLSHIRIKHPSEFICGVCGNSFVSELGLAMHKTMMHKDVTEDSDLDVDGKESGPYCSQCDVQFAGVRAWKRHMVTSVKHIKTSHFNNGCRVCGETFEDAESLRTHHRNEHPSKRPKNYGRKPSKRSWPDKCEHCSKEISNAREHYTHFRREHPDKNYPIQRNHVCDICHKGFRGKAFLVYHKRTHTSEREFKCQKCPKAFFNRTNLQMHQKAHSDHRPYPCNLCSKAFKCKGSLDRHSRIHTGVKPYVCKECGKAYGQKTSLKLHTFSVHLKQPPPYTRLSRPERRKLIAERNAAQTAHTKVT